MTMAGVHITTLVSPSLYTTEQIEMAVAIAEALQRGRFILTDKPKR